MATIAPHPRLKDVENAANFIALTADNFEVLAAELAKREPTYQNGSPTTIIGPPTSGARVLNEFWCDALGGEFRCTAAGTPGTWTQIRPAAVTADPITGTIPVGYLILNTPAFDACYGEVRIGPVGHLRVLDLGVGPPVWYGAGRSDTEGSPAPASMNLAVRSALRSRANVKAAARSMRIDVKQAVNLIPHPTLVIRRNPAVGLEEDVTATASAGTGWVTITASFTAAADGAVWFEPGNNLDGHFPCHFDNLVLA
jgi:hypothetical protein